MPRPPAPARPARAAWSTRRAEHVAGRPRPAADAQTPRVYDRQIVLVASTFNRPLTSRLLQGAARALSDAGIPRRNQQVIWVPGAFELPVVAARIAQGSPRPDAIIALGVLIRGETSQYQVIAHAVAQGLSQLAVSAVVPVTFGVVIADTAAQARARAGGAQGNRGAEAAHAAVAVLHLFDRLGPEGPE